MAEKTNKEALHVVGVEDVMALYDKLTPMEQKDVSDIFGTDFSEFSDADILNHFNIDPVEFIDASDVRDSFGCDVLSEYKDYEILDELRDRLWKIDPCDILDIIEEKVNDGSYRHDFTESDLERLEKVVAAVREKINNKAKKD